MDANGPNPTTAFAMEIGVFENSIDSNCNYVCVPGAVSLTAQFCSACGRSYCN
jgi:hypothetical protein